MFCCFKADRHAGSYNASFEDGCDAAIVRYAGLYIGGYGR